MAMASACFMVPAASIALPRGSGDLILRKRGHTHLKFPRYPGGCIRNLNSAIHRHRESDFPLFRGSVVAAGQDVNGVPGPDEGDQQFYNNADQGMETEASLGNFKNAVNRAALRYFTQLSVELKEDVGLDIDELKQKYIVLRDEVMEQYIGVSQVLVKRMDLIKAEGTSLADNVRLRLWPQFVIWNSWEHWKKIKDWNLWRMGALIFYMVTVAIIVQGAHLALSRPRARKVADAFLESVIPEPNDTNLKRLKKALWRKNMPDGYNVEKYYLSPDGTYYPDESYVGRNAWDNGKEITLDDGLIRPPMGSTWKERLLDWQNLLIKDKLKDREEIPYTKYVVKLSWPEIQENHLKKQDNKVSDRSFRAFWVARRWWKFRPKLPYTYLLSKVEKLEVESAVYSANTRSLFVTMKEGFPSEYVVDIPVDPYLYDSLQKCGVEVDVLHRPQIVYMLRALSITLPCLAVFMAIQVQLYNARKTTSERIVDLIKMNSSKLLLPGDSKSIGLARYNDVILEVGVWKVIEEITTYLKDPMKYHSRGVKLPRGILLYGPPGTGKTHLARAMAKELHLPFVFCSGSEFGDSEFSGADKLNDIFFTARANAPALVFIDEVDALAGKHVVKDGARERTFEQLLEELDGSLLDTAVDRFSLRQAVILVCATNRKGILHERFLQPGRIDREIYIGFPNERERIRIFDVHSTIYPLADDVDFSKIVYRTKGFSGADIRGLVIETVAHVVKKKQSKIYQQDIVEVLDKQLFEGAGIALTDEDQEIAIKKIPFENKRLLAVHEAGHILLAHLFPDFDWHAFSHLLPGGVESAVSVFYPTEQMLEMGSTVGYLKMQMTVAHGGRCAEQLCFGEVSDGGFDDLTKISRMAREIASSRANPRLGLTPIVRDTAPGSKRSRREHRRLMPNKWNRRTSFVPPMTPELSEMFTREVTRYIDETEAQAMEGLRNNHRILEKLADLLLEKIYLRGEEVDEFIKSLNPVMLPDLMKPLPLNLDVEITVPRISPEKSGRYERLEIYPAPLHRC